MATTTIKLNDERIGHNDAQAELLEVTENGEARPQQLRVIEAFGNAELRRTPFASVQAAAFSEHSPTLGAK